MEKEEKQSTLENGTTNKKDVCVQCGSPLYSTNGYENDILLFCCKIKCQNFGLLQLGSKSLFLLLEYEKRKNTKWVEIIEK